MDSGLSQWYSIKIWWYKMINHRRQMPANVLGMKIDFRFSPIVMWCHKNKQFSCLVKKLINFYYFSITSARMHALELLKTNKSSTSIIQNSLTIQFNECALYIVFLTTSSPLSEKQKKSFFMFVAFYATITILPWLVFHKTEISFCHRQWCKKKKRHL